MSIEAGATSNSNRFNPLRQLMRRGKLTPCPTLLKIQKTGNPRDYAADLTVLDKEWILRSPYDPSLVQAIAERYNTLPESADQYIKYLKGISTPSADQES